MGLGETAVIAVELKLNGVTAYKSGITEAEAATAGLNKTASKSTNILGGTTSNLSLLKQAAGSTGTAIKGMGEHLKGVLTGPLGLIGLGAGVFTIAGTLKETITYAQDLGLATEKLTALTGESAAVVSTQVAVFQKYGLSVLQASTLIGFAEKTLGKLAATAAGKGAPGLTKLQALQARYNITLTDGKGAAVDFETELRNVSDFYVSHAAASTKAYVASQLFGRGYATLIPVLRLGSKGIIEAEQAASDLGLTLTQQNASDLREYQRNIRETGDAISGLQLQLGLSLIPTIGDLAKSLRTFLAHGGTQQIVAGFKSVLQTAKDLGKVVTGTVVPTIQGLASIAKSFWDSIPAPLRDLLVKGFIADRTIHFLFGVSPISLGKSLLGDIAGPIIRTLIANRLVPQPVIVVNPSGVGGGGSLLPEVAAGGLGSLTALTIAIGAGVTAGIVAANIQAGLFNQPGADPTAVNNAVKSGKLTYTGRVFVPRPNAGSDGTHPGREQGAPQASQAPFQVERAAQNIADSAAFFSNKVRMSFRGFADLYDREQKLLGYTHDKSGHTVGGMNAIGSLGILKGTNLQTVADALAAKFTRSQAPYYKSITNEQRTLAALQKAQTAAIQRGDTHTATALGHDIDVLKTDLGRKTDGVKHAIDRKKSSFTVNNTIKNSTFLDGRVLAANIQRYVQVYGSGRIGIGGQIS